MPTAYKTYDDQDLISLLSKDDDQAFAEIYQRYSATLFTYAFNILKHTGGAEDAVQEIFLSLWKRKNELSHIHSLGGYLTQSIKYFVLRAIKEEKRDQDFFKRITEITQDIEISDPALYFDLQQIINRIISSLPEDHQQIYRLNREQGLTYQEIANNLNISVKTVEKKMSKTLQHLRFGVNQALTLAVIIKHMF
jgi:RNA polymerase sigma-70 factor (family 1)